MANWKNLNSLNAYNALLNRKDSVDLSGCMSGENGAGRVKKYDVKMAEGLHYNFAAKQVDDGLLAVMQELADEAALTEKFEDLYNGAVINTGENRLVLHHLTRGQLGKDVVAQDVNKREFYVTQQKNIAAFAG